MELTGLDVFDISMTIAGACMKAFCANYLEGKEVALVPELGYDIHDRQSEIAIKFLKWYAVENEVDVRHAFSPGFFKLYSSIFT